MEKKKKRCNVGGIKEGKESAYSQRLDLEGVGGSLRHLDNSQLGLRHKTFEFP